MRHIPWVIPMRGGLWQRLRQRQGGDGGVGESVTALITAKGAFQAKLV